MLIYLLFSAPTIRPEVNKPSQGMLGICNAFVYQKTHLLVGTFSGVSSVHATFVKHYEHSVVRNICSITHPFF